MTAHGLARLSRIVSCVAVLGWGGVGLAPAQDVEKTVEKRIEKTVELGEAQVTVSISGGEDGVVVTQQVAGADDPFLGVVLAPVGRALRKHLGLEEGRGMLVESVLEGSPAAKAGIQEDDLLLGCGDQSVGCTEDLAKALKAAKGEPVHLKLLRGGKELDLEATPAPRGRDMRVLKADSVQVLRTTPGKGGEKGGVVELEVGKQPWKFNVVQPAIVMKTQLADLPKGLSVTIHKEGDQPATIRAQRKDHVWETTEDKLEALPEDVRGSVESLLRGGFPRISVQRPDAEAQKQILESLKLWQPLAPKAPPKLTVPRVEAPQLRELKIQPRRVQPVAPTPDIEKRMDAIQKQLDDRLQRLEEQLQKLQKTLESASEPPQGASV